ncbi:hypothetical protein FPV67DRAFT_162580 [Lyophyllum atratum]|nr:hypothetical protein FPV67DRAFT_162580 [Lyophyllum atratum]
MSRPQRKPALPKAIRTLVNRATEEPYEYLPSLLEILRDEPSWAAYPEVIPLFFRQFERTPPSSRVAREDIIAFELAKMALDGVAAAKSMTVHREAADKDFDLSYLLPSWPAMWKWMHYLYYEIDDGRKLDTTFNAASRPLVERLFIMNIMQRIFSLLFMYECPSPICEAIAASDGVLKMAMEIWVRHPDRPRNLLIPWLERGKGISMALSDILDLEPTESPELASGFGIGQKALAALLIKPLRFVANEGENRWSSTSGYIHVYSKLTKRAPEIMRMVLAHDLIDEVLSTLEALLSIPAPVLPAIHDCTRGCFILIIHAEPLHSNYGWLLDSLRSKLVQCLLRFAGRPLEGHDAEDGGDHSAHPALLGIIRILQRYVVHRPVLKLLGNIGRSQSVNSLRLQLPSDSRLRVEWTVFLAHVFELQKIQASFEQSEESKMKCFSYACMNVETSKRFQRCGQCQEAVYCSLLCQREDWQNGSHREACRASCNGRPETGVRISLRDRAYFSFLADNLMKEKHKDITDFRDRLFYEHPTTSPRSLCLSLDFLRYPPTTAVFLESAFDPCNPYMKSQEELVRPSTSIIRLPAVSQQSARLPIVQPCFMIRYALDRMVAIYTPSRASGDLFGWLDAAQPSDE